MVRGQKEITSYDGGAQEDEKGRVEITGNTDNSNCDKEKWIRETVAQDRL
jgi:hypothetical protein